MISVVCVFNDETVLNNYLLKSLKNQTATHEIVLINNIEGNWQSAAQALNYGGKLAKNEYIMFCHQDIEFTPKDWLERIESYIVTLPSLGIAGAAGKRKDGSLSNSENGYPPIPAGNIKISSVESVQTLDECLLIIPKFMFDLFQFDERVCNDWHLYGVDYCLTAKKMGYMVYVLPIKIYHKSAGQSLSKSYFEGLSKMQTKWKNDFSIIYTTMGDWKTTIPLFIQPAFQFLYINYAIDRYILHLYPTLWKFLKILYLFIIGLLSKMGELIGKNKIGFKPYLNQIKLLKSVKKG